MAFHPMDKPLSEPHTNAQRHDTRNDSAERDVSEQAYTEQAIEIGK